MLQQIFSHTPLYVWAILAFLVYRGLLASRAREVTVKSSAILPLVMLLLALQGIHSAFGFDGLAPVTWLLGGLASATLVWRLAPPAALSADPARGTLRLRGSWAPLVTMMAIFCMKYAVAVTLAVRPGLHQTPTFVLPVCLLYGVFSGVFAAGLVRRLAIYQQARQAQLLPASVLSSKFVA